MNLLIVNKFDSFGGAAIASYRVKLMLQNKINVKFLVLTGQNADYQIVNNKWKNQIAFFKFALGRLFDFVVLKNRSNLFYFDSLRFGFDIAKHPAFRWADIIHLNWINFGFLSFGSLKKIFSLNKPIVWTFHDMWPLTGGCFHSRGCFNFLSDCRNCPFLNFSFVAKNLFLKKAKLFAYDKLFPVAVSSWMKNFIDNSPLFVNKPILLPNPIDTQIFKPIPVNKKQLGLNPDKIHIGFIAFNLSNYYKGGSFLIEALKIIRKKYPSVYNKIQLVAIGRLKNKDFFPNDLDIVFTGYVNDQNLMIKFYNAMDIFVHPSLEESFSLVIQEAMATETPVVAFSVGGIPDLIDHNINGYLAQYKNSSDLANGIVKLIENQDFYKKISINARKKILNNFSFDVLADKYLKFYASVLKTSI